MTDLADRDFWARIDRRAGPTGCWPYNGGETYGAYWLRGAQRSVAAHRHAYTLAVGPIRDGLVIDHLCRNPACCNPAHLEPVTQSENLRRGYRSREGVAVASGRAARRRTHAITRGAGRRLHTPAFDEFLTLRAANPRIVAERASISEGHMSDLRSGRRLVSPVIAAALADALNLSSADPILWPATARPAEVAS